MDSWDEDGVNAALDVFAGFFGGEEFAGTGQMVADGSLNTSFPDETWGTTPTEFRAQVFRNLGNDFEAPDAFFANDNTIFGAIQGRDYPYESFENIFDGNSENNADSNRYSDNMGNNQSTLHATAGQVHNNAAAPMTYENLNTNVGESSEAHLASSTSDSYMPSCDEVSSDEASGDEASGDKASSDKASSDKASSYEASSDKASSYEASSNMASVDEAYDDEEASGVETSGNEEAYGVETSVNEVAPGNEASGGKASGGEASDDEASDDERSAHGDLLMPNYDPSNLPIECARIIAEDPVNNWKLPFVMKDGERVRGTRGSYLRNFGDGFPERISPDASYTPYLIFLQDKYGATTDDFRNRMEEDMNTTAITNRIGRERQRQGRLAYKELAFNRKLGTHALKTLENLTFDQVRFNTCWEVDATKGLTRQNKDSEWLKVPHPAGDFHKVNMRMETLVKAYEEKVDEAAEQGTHWTAVMPKLNRGAHGSRPFVRPASSKKRNAANPPMVLGNVRVSKKRN
ncbi:hypothetical protein NA57DRAFT_82151 [Rhizodiscina lignyota]|uniref:Uncharacterized protein n=1 Tax=Rhizodiscina lignyota TaxID=1504668 RepID=A0A9P4I6B6_9PEZI|nr:hypothetical protein NA57DRAFT_82151 [Rhizodiscina lignyota]